jgi:hypothetical protein
MHHQDCENNWLTEEPAFCPQQALLFINFSNIIPRTNTEKESCLNSRKERQKKGEYCDNFEMRIKFNSYLIKALKHKVLWQISDQ